MVHGIRPDELLRLTPKLKPYLRRPNPTWPEIVDAADWLRHDLGVSKSLWGDACLAMGRELAAVALAIVSTKEAEHFQTSPGGYFHGMVAKAKAGELHLERTVWALRRASEPEHHRAGRGGDRARRDRGLGMIDVSCLNFHPLGSSTSTCSADTPSRCRILSPEVNSGRCATRAAAAVHRGDQRSVHVPGRTPSPIATRQRSLSL